jgi:hypothetical protein
MPFASKLKRLGVRGMFEQCRCQVVPCWCTGPFAQKHAAHDAVRVHFEICVANACGGSSEDWNGQSFCRALSISG